MARLFGTDGVRGVANTELTCELAYRLGIAAVRFAGRHIVIGRDTRRSGEMLENALVAGILSAGGVAHLAGIIPTPAIALLTRELGMEGGVVISASHNPPEFNGIKFFDGSGMKLPDAVEDQIEAFVTGEIPAPEDRPSGPEIGWIEKVKNARELYVAHAISTIGCRLDGLKVAVDCAHGASCKTTPEALERLGAHVIAINTDHDGCDINVGCGSTHLEQIRALVAEVGADVGLAHDGDADRVLFIDEKGQEVDGDFTLAICGKHLHDAGALAQNEIVSTVMCNLGFTLATRELGIDIVQTAVGDRYVLERMLEDGARLGGEQSGHIIFLDHNSTGDGLVTALHLLSVMAETGKPLSELRQVMKRFPQELVNVHCHNKAAYEGNAAIAEAVAIAEEELGEKGRVLVRPSGTEPLIRVMVEAEHDEDCSRLANGIADVIRAQLS
jgi:phosphoglucosamine mutase